MRNDPGTGFATLARTFVREFPQEASHRLEKLPADEIARLLRAQPVRHAAALTERLGANVAADVLDEMPPDARRDILATIDPVRAVAILGWMDDQQRDAALQLLDPSLAREIRAMSEYPPETAGRLMDPQVVGFKPGSTVQQALSLVRTVRTRRVADVFVTDEEGILVGTVPLQLLAVAPSDTLVNTLARPAVAVRAIDPEEDVVEYFNKGRLSSVPVVDFEGRLIGVIRYDTLAIAAQENVAGDMQAMVGASRQERALSPVLFAVKKRLPWLEMNLATAFLGASVVGLFEGTIARFTALAVLMPIVSAQSGNTGAQALAVTMRGLAMREIRVGQWPRVVRKEASVALLNGIAVSITVAGGVFVWSRSPGLALVIGSAMIVSMITAGVVGVMVPMVLTTFRQDPAQSSTIILTTVTDIVGFGSFLGIATILAGML